MGTGLEGFPGVAVGEFGATSTGVNFHDFGGGGVEGVFTGENEAEGFLGAVFKVDGIADDFSVEVEVGFAADGDVFKLAFHRYFSFVWVLLFRGVIGTFCSVGARDMGAGGGVVELTVVTEKFAGTAKTNPPAFE